MCVGECAAPKCVHNFGLLCALHGTKFMRALFGAQYSWHTLLGNTHARTGARSDWPLAHNKLRQPQLLPSLPRHQQRPYHFHAHRFQELHHCSCTTVANTAGCANAANSGPLWHQLDAAPPVIARDGPIAATAVAAAPALWRTLFIAHIVS